MKRLSTLSTSYALFALGILLYLLSVFMLPTNSVTQAMYDLSESQYEFLLFAIRIPIMGAWLVAFVSYIALRQYQQKLVNARESEAFTLITRGIGWFAWGYLIINLLRTMLYGLGREVEGFLPTALAIATYMNVLIALLAFKNISTGVHKLAQTTNVHLTSRQTQLAVLALTAFGVVCCVLVQSRLGSTDLMNTMNTYYLPNWAVWTTVVTPFLFAWFIGLIAALELMVLSRRTQGVIYRRGLALLALGIVAIVIAHVLLQYYRIIIPRTGSLSLGPSLAITYCMYTLGAIGSLLVINGARKLKKIEEV